MYDPRCVRCRSARNAGYDGCAIHNRARLRYNAPTVVVVESHHHGYTPPVGVDITDGDLVVPIGGGLGIDTRTGDLEVNIGGGAYMDVTPDPICEGGWDDGGCSSDW